ncbi:hypothetical protein, partial [Streptomyces sp. LUP47B]|uniref:hypothetical protein n=1 Tax=Streptomyces sp. LUP47B TaxID=1890286 RepID=UPI00114CB82A
QGGCRLPGGGTAAAGVAQRASGGGRMMCDRCDQPIPPGQEERVPGGGASGAGTVVVLHRVLCRRSPSHAAPYPAGLGR